MRLKVIWLDSFRAKDRNLVGGKASNLARLVALGFPVPRGFVIPVDVLRVEDSAWEGAVLRAGRQLRGPVAVRSSMVGEDETLQSFAGQLDTVLGVQGEEALLTAIRQVQASASAPQLRTYAERHSPRGPSATRGGRRSATTNDDHLAMAVLVQEMVPAKAAGVAFSADPLTGRSTVIIEAVPHLAEDLVQGRAEPDRFIMDPRGAITLERRIALGSRDLPAKTISDLGDMVRQIAAHFGIPQDVEWAWDGRGISILQSRAITSLVGQNVYSRKLVGDMAPGPIKHLVWSTNTLGMVEGVFGEVFTSLIGKNDYDFSCILRRIRSRAYVDTTFVGRLLGEVGLPRNLFEAIAREEKVPKRIKLNRKLIGRGPRILSFLWRQLRLENELSSVLENHERALEAFREADWTSSSPSQLIPRVQDLLALHRGLQRCIMYGSMNLGIRTRLLKRFVVRHAPHVDPARLFVGLKGLKSVAPNRELLSIAAETHGLEESQVAIIASGNTSEIRESLGSSEEGARVLARVEEFLERFRFLSANGTNFGEPTWAEEPGPVWSSLGRMIRDGPPNAPCPAVLREQARGEVLARLGPVGQWRFKKRLASVGRYLELREGTSLLMTEDTYELRRLFLAMGAHLVEAGRIQHPGDVFFLYFEELCQAFEGKRQNELNVLIQDRRAEIARDREVELPETILGEEIPEEIPLSEPGSLLTGIGVSAGVVRGTARVVRELADAPTLLTREDVLIVPFSDVGWTPLFATVGGIVAEHGGQLSHTAIVAREYGLPAVVGVRGAMREIQDGQTVTVDGGKGRVHLGESPSAGTF